jgi:uncharacterized membrane protein YadS
VFIIRVDAGRYRELRTSEDWWAIWLGGIILAIAFCTTSVEFPRAEPSAIEIDAASRSVASPEEKDEAPDAAPVASNLLSAWVSTPAGWTWNPGQSLFKQETFLLGGILGAGAGLMLLFTLALRVMGWRVKRFPPAFAAVFLLAILAYVISGQAHISGAGLEYALWALLLGLAISNTIGTPQAIRPAVLTEFYIKTGLVLLGAEVLMSRLLVLGVPGLFVAWVVTPIVLVSTFLIGQKLLKIASPSLNMVISADMSVCGVSAAIATAAACKAKKEELSLAIGMSLSFTVVMMFVLPMVIKALEMDQILGGAWIGGTIDSSGAVAAAGALLGEQALEVAVTVKMIQNILIGIVAFCVAVYWVTCVERETDEGEGPRAESQGPRAQGQGTGSKRHSPSALGPQPSALNSRPGLGEIWKRFPKFVLGFVGASVLFSILYARWPGGEAIVQTMTGDVTKTLRNWLFCLAFVSIGLETDFRSLAKYLAGGRPLLLYLLGQSLNLMLTLLMAWLMFRVVFRESVDAILPG